MRPGDVRGQGGVRGVDEWFENFVQVKESAYLIEMRARDTNENERTRPTVHDQQRNRILARTMLMHKMKAKL